MTQYEVRLTEEARTDLRELYAFLLEREPAAALRAEDAIERTFELLRHSPFSCRRSPAPHAPARVRELVIAFGKRGYVALFEIDDDKTVTVLAVRHQREDDYH